MKAEFDPQLRLLGTPGLVLAKVVNTSPPFRIVQVILTVSAQDGRIAAIAAGERLLSSFLGQYGEERTMIIRARAGADILADFLAEEKQNLLLRQVPVREQSPKEARGVWTPEQLDDDTSAYRRFLTLMRKLPARDPDIDTAMRWCSGILHRHKSDLTPPTHRAMQRRSRVTVHPLFGRILRPAPPDASSPEPRELVSRLRPQEESAMTADEVLNELGKLDSELRAVEEPIRRKLQELLDQLVGKQFGTLDANQAVASALQQLLNRLVVGIACPRCGAPAAIRCQHAGRTKHGLFQFQHPLNGAPRATHVSLNVLPAMPLSPAPPDLRRKPAGSR